MDLKGLLVQCFLALAFSMLLAGGDSQKGPGTQHSYQMSHKFAAACQAEAHRDPPSQVN